LTTEDFIRQINERAWEKLKDEEPPKIYKVKKCIGEKLIIVYPEEKHEEI
jgi:hypothetical protein